MSTDRIPLVVERSTGFMSREYFHPVSAEACAITRAFRTTYVSETQLGILKAGGLPIEVREPVTFPAKAAA